jgi:hypothetical protein
VVVSRWQARWPKTQFTTEPQKHREKRIKGSDSIPRATLIGSCKSSLLKKSVLVVFAAFVVFVVFLCVSAVKRL